MCFRKGLKSSYYLEDWLSRRGRENAYLPRACDLLVSFVLIIGMTCTPPEKSMGRDFGSYRTCVLVLILSIKHLVTLAMTLTLSS